MINKQRVIEQLQKDEGFVPRARWDIKQWTYGYGTRAPHKDALITKAEALIELGKHVDIAIKGFYEIFRNDLDKFNEVRAEAFVNMIFNMGAGNSKAGLRSFKKTLSLIQDYAEVDWNAVSVELSKSKWYSQVGNRAKRICQQIKTGEI